MHPNSGSDEATLNPEGELRPDHVESLRRRLYYSGFEAIPLRDREQRYINIERFAATSRGNDVEVLLERMIAHPRYHHDYTSWSDVAVDEPVHGPYMLNRISAGSFLPVSKHVAHRMIDEFVLSSGEEVAGDAWEEIAFRVHRYISRSQFALTLPELDGSAVHDRAPILGDFIELVLIEVPMPWPDILRLVTGSSS